MTNHLMGRHGSPTRPSVWMQLGESVEQFVPIPRAQESLHWGRLYAEIQIEYLVLLATACHYPLPRTAFNKTQLSALMSWLDLAVK